MHLEHTRQACRRARTSALAYLTSPPFNRPRAREAMRNASSGSMVVAHLALRLWSASFWSRRSWTRDQKRQRMVHDPDQIEEEFGRFRPENRVVLFRVLGPKSQPPIEGRLITKHQRQHSKRAEKGSLWEANFQPSWVSQSNREAPRPASQNVWPAVLHEH